MHQWSPCKTMFSKRYQWAIHQGFQLFYLRSSQRLWYEGILGLLFHSFLMCKFLHCVVLLEIISPWLIFPSFDVWISWTSRHFLPLTIHLLIFLCIWHFAAFCSGRSILAIPLCIHNPAPDIGCENTQKKTLGGNTHFSHNIFFYPAWLPPYCTNGDGHDDVEWLLAWKVQPVRDEADFGKPVVILDDEENDDVHSTPCVTWRWQHWHLEATDNQKTGLVATIGCNDDVYFESHNLVKHSAYNV